MDHSQEELVQITTWCSEEGLGSDSPKEAQMCLLWRTLQSTKSHLSKVTWDRESQRSKHLAEMAEVRKSLEQIRVLTEHKDVLAQEIQDENDKLKEQLRRLVSLQDSQINEVAKMLYQQGLTELIHSSPSEQVAYLLVERASLLETSDDRDNLQGDGHTASLLGKDGHCLNTKTHQSSHKRAPCHGQSPWRRLFGLHKASQNKNTAEVRHVAGQQTTVEWDCSRWERDVEEGSRRLAMAHSEIRRLTDELESAHMTQRTYEPELQAAQQEVEQLRHEVEKLKKYEIVELRKAKELNDRLDIEIRALRDRVRSLDAEKRSLQHSVVSLQEKLEKQESALQEHPHPTQLVQVASLQREVERLTSALQEQQHAAEQQILQVQAHQAHESAECQATELSERKETCRDFQNKMTIQSGWLSAKESEIHTLKHQLDKSQKELSALITIICSKDNNLQTQQRRKHTVSDSRHGDNTHDQSQHLLPNRETPLQKDCPDYQEVLNTLFDNQDKCEALEKEICETLKCLDKERSKCHEMKEKHKARLCRAKQKFDDETTWRDEKIKNLERELSLCSHSLAKEKELNQSITVENDKLLVERRKLLRQLSEEEENKMHFLEMENKELRNKMVTMSKQFAALEHNLQNVHSLHFAKELKKIFTSSSVPVLSGKKPELPEDLDVLDNNQARRTMSSSPHLVTPGPLSGSVELGYLNVTSTQSCSDPSAHPDSVSSTDSTFC